jgi:hypothetical protein
MTRSGSARHADVLRAWLQGELGEAANICHQRIVDPCAGASAAHQFTISMPAADASGLLLLRNRAGRAHGNGIAVTVVRVEPVGVIEHTARLARRDFVIHVRGDA